MSSSKKQKTSTATPSIAILSALALIISIFFAYNNNYTNLLPPALISITSSIGSLIPKIIPDKITTTSSSATTPPSSSSNIDSQVVVKPKTYDFQAAMTKSSVFKFIPRLSASRGYANHGWLQSYHSFSFASYYDPSHTHYGPLRVINEDNIAPREGFDKHPHSAYEIFSYVLEGELTHKDSMGNTEVMKRGDVQHTRAGTGISHSEQNFHPNKEAKLLQIWVKPDVTKLPPKYFTRHHDEASKRGILKHIVAPVKSFAKDAVIPEQDGKDELIPIQTDLNFFASMLPAGQSVSHQFMKQAGAENAVPSRPRLGYLHLVMSSGIRSPKTPAPADGAKVKVTADDGTEIELTEGDALKIEAKEMSTITIESTGGREAEFVFFDMKPE